jgi:hypothetical protein
MYQPIETERNTWKQKNLFYRSGPNVKAHFLKGDQIW